MINGKIKVLGRFRIKGGVKLFIKYKTSIKINLVKSLKKFLKVKFNGNLTCYYLA